ncbi:MAG: TetR/AcrR family transcriptional regulator [Bdellovibrio sp.]
MIKLSKGQLTKIRIIEVATDLFMADGLYNVTFAEISHGVGISPAGIYRHFVDMDDLILEACLYWVENIKNFLEKDQTEILQADKQLYFYLERTFIYASKNRATYGLLLGLYFYSMRSSKMLKVYKNIKAGGVLRIELILQRGHLDKSWEIQQSHEVAKSLHSIMVGEIIKLIIEPKEETSMQRLNRVYKIFLDIIKSNTPNSVHAGKDPLNP